MSNASSAQYFDENRAQVYDEQAGRLAPARDALHACLPLVMASLPDDARIVCVGAGTGAEMLTLAASNPGWRFTAVEPAPAMLARCRQRAQAAGIAERCVFHEGTLDSLPEGEPFDGATAIFVSHFLVDIQERRQFFIEIAKRLRPGGLLVSCDHATELRSTTFDSLFELWDRMCTRAGFPVNREALEKGVGLISPQAVERLIGSSGFDAPVPFFQMLLLHGWVTRRVAI